MTAKTWLPPLVGFPAGATAASVGAWIEDFRQSMLEIGLAQTSDTGQFSLGAFAYSAVEGEVTYLMFSFTDTLQATHPIFIRVGIRGYYITSGSMSVACQVVVGSETNGAGVVTRDAVSLTRSVAYQYGANASQTQGYSHQSFSCFSADKGFVGVVFCPGRMYATNQNTYYAPIAFFVERIPGEDGVPSDRGFTLWGPNQTLTFQDPPNYSNTAGFDRVTAMHGVTRVFGGGAYGGGNTIPYFQSAATITQNVFVMHGFHTAPEPIRSNGIVAIPSGRVTKGTEFLLPVYGSDPANFVVMDHECALRPCGATTDAVVGFLFE